MSGTVAWRMAWGVSVDLGRPCVCLREVRGKDEKLAKGRSGQPGPVQAEQTRPLWPEVCTVLTGEVASIVFLCKHPWSTEYARSQGIYRPPSAAWLGQGSETTSRHDRPGYWTMVALLANTAPNTPSRQYIT
jgi:hypothetical protein